MKQEHVRGIPKYGGHRMTCLMKDRGSLLGTREIAVCFQPDFDSCGSDVLSQVAHGLGNPGTRGIPIRARLDGIAEHPDGRCVEGGCQIGDALPFSIQRARSCGSGK